MRSALFSILLLTVSIPASAGSFTPLLPNPGEPSLLSTLDLIYGAGNYTRVSDDLDQLWAGQATLSAVAISSYAGAIQRLGVCVLCNGFDDIVFDQQITADGIFSQTLTVNGSPTLVINDPLFRFFNDPTEHFAVGRAYSDPSLNPAGGDHMVTFAVNGSPDTFVLAFEDWLFTMDPASDRDYNDFVVQVTFVRPDIQETPEPATALLLGAGLLLAVRLSRARARSRQTLP